jgi:hypothetical protein
MEARAGPVCLMPEIFAAERSRHTATLLRNLLKPLGERLTGLTAQDHPGRLPNYQQDGQNAMDRRSARKIIPWLAVVVQALIQGCLHHFVSKRQMRDGSCVSEGDKGQR